jgi:hypothetical protein
MRKIKLTVGMQKDRGKESLNLSQVDEVLQDSLWFGGGLNPGKEKSHSARGSIFNMLSTFFFIRHIFDVRVVELYR